MARTPVRRRLTRSLTTRYVAARRWTSGAWSRSHAILNPAHAGRGTLPATAARSKASGRAAATAAWGAARLSFQIATRAASERPAASSGTTPCICAPTPTAATAAPGFRRSTADALRAAADHQSSGACSDQPGAGVNRSIGLEALSATRPARSTSAARAVWVPMSTASTCSAAATAPVSPPGRYSR